MLSSRNVGILFKILPPLAAFACVHYSAWLTNWSGRHETTLLILLFALVGSLLHPQLRHSVITTLCFGVGFLAARDIIYTLGMPAELRAGTYHYLRMIALGMISALSMLAAVAETLRPGTVWARRCYFAGASLYFLGAGFNTYIAYRSWQAIIMLVTGVAALAGVIFARNIVEMEREEDVESPADSAIHQEELQKLHQRVLQQKEWHDPDLDPQ